jgi:hypothetical protein
MMKKTRLSSGELMRVSSKDPCSRQQPMSKSRRARRRLAAKVGAVQTVAAGAAEVGGEGGGGPDGGRGEESGEDLRRCGFVAADDGYGGAVKGSNGGGFIGGVAEPLAGKGRFDFEYGVDAFGGQMESRGMREQRRRIEVVEDGNVDLAGAMAGGVDYEGGGGSVTLGEIAIE